MGLLQTLGLKPTRSRAAGAAAGSAAVKTADKASPQMAALAQQYATVKQQALAALASLTGASLEGMHNAIQSELVDAAAARAKAGDFAAGMKLLGQVASRAAAALESAQRVQLARGEVEAARMQISALVLGGIQDVDTRDLINSELAKFQAAFDKADAAKDMAAREKAFTALKVPAQALLARAQSARQLSDWVIANYMPLIVPAQAAIGQVPLAQARDVLQKAYDGTEADVAKLTLKLDLATIQGVCQPLMKQVQGVASRIVARTVPVDQELVRVARLIKGLGAAATDAVKGKLAELEQQKKSSWPPGASVAQLEAGLAAFDAALVELRKQAQALEDKRLGEQADKKKVAVEKTLKLFKDTADGLKDAKAKADALKLFEAFKKRLDAAVAEKEVAARGKAIAAVERDARAELTKLKKLAFQDQLQEKGGREKLDKTIADMGAATTDPDQLAVVEAAIEARFGVEVTTPPEEMKKKSLPKLYNMLTKVPDWQSKQSSLKKLDFGTEAEANGNYYQGGNLKRIALNSMPDAEDGSVKVPDVDPDKKTVKANYFDFTTLHEVGHAVDDKIGFMSQRMNDARFGGWKSETPSSIVDWLAKEGGFLKRHSGGPKVATEADLKLMLKAFLLNKACPKPANAAQPMGSLLAQWDVIVNDPIIATCVEGMREGDAAWRGGAAKAGKLVVNGRCFHEAYTGDWYSYDHASRASTGVSTYQWRAPGEWFAEIYALFYLGKLSQSHPMHKWFTESAKDEKTASLAPAKMKG
jgi:hypothetical protein